MTPRSPYSAIADPTRRAILDLLRDGGEQTAGEIASHFCSLSRPAVSKHLRILRQAGLVCAEPCGREWHYTLHVGPLRQVYQDWLARYEPLWGESCERRNCLVESSEEGVAIPIRHRG